MHRILGILSIIFFIGIDAFAQKADFINDDLRVFELRGRVKKVTLLYEDWILGSYIEFDENGDFSDAEFEVRYNDDNRIVRILSSEYINEQQAYIEEYMKEYDCGENEALYYAFGSLGPSLYYISWDGGRPKWMSGGGNGNYFYGHTYGADGNMASYELAAGLTGYAYKSYKYKYNEFDKFGNWTKRTINGRVERRTIEYYDFEGELAELRTDGSLSDIVQFAERMNDINEFRLATEATDLWNQRAVNYCKTSSEITIAVQAVLDCSIATEDTRHAAIELWCNTYLDRMRAADDPTSVVNEILASSIAKESTKVEASNYWNERAKSRVDNAANPTEEAEKYVDNKLLKADYRDYLLATVYNYEVQHHVNGVTDYKALYREAEVKCGSHYVFDEDQRARIVKNSNELKRADVIRLIDKANDLMNSDQLDESRKCVLQALGIEPNYEPAHEARAEVEYRILWNKVMASTAWPNDFDEYMNHNHGSKHTDNLILVRNILLHLDHKNGGPRKLFKKMQKTGTVPPAEKVQKVIQKCVESDRK